MVGGSDPPVDLSDQLRKLFFKSGELEQKHLKRAGHWLLKNSPKDGSQGSSNPGLEGQCPATFRCVLDSTRFNHLHSAVKLLMS